MYEAFSYQYKDMNIELKKAIAQAQVLLDDAEAARSNGCLLTYADVC